MLERRKNACGCFFFFFFFHVILLRSYLINACFLFPFEGLYPVSVCELELAW